MELPAGVYRFAINRHVFKPRECISDHQALNRRVADTGVKTVGLRIVLGVGLQQLLRDRSERIDAADGSASRLLRVQYDRGDDFAAIVVPPFYR